MKFIVGLLFFSSSLLTVSLQAQSILKGIVNQKLELLFLMHQFNYYNRILLLYKEQQPIVPVTIK